MKNILSWSEVEADSDILVEKICADNYAPEVLVGIARGGLVPLALLAKQFPDAKVLTISAKSYDGERQGEVEVGGIPDIDLSDKKVLLVDEIVDHGSTLRKVSEALTAKYQIGTLKTAVLVMNTVRCKFPPSYAAREVEDWVIFPWDKTEQ